jgi:cell division protein FtsB
VATIHQEIGEEIMGWVACCVLIAFLLPMGAMLYLDILDAKHEVKAQTEKLERLRRQIEREKRDDKATGTKLNL